MRQLTAGEKEQLWEEAKNEHPGDSMLQEIRYVRLLHAAQTKDMTIEERIHFYTRQAEGAAESVRGLRKAS
jgi:hypothetical protein